MTDLTIASYGGEPLTSILGKTFTSVTRTDNLIEFRNDTECFRLEHLQDCCERVYIEDINGDLADLEATPIVEAYRETNGKLPPRPNNDDSYTWTFFRFRTIKGTVTVRFFGSSNGYYSEDATLYKYIED